jgi:hypothetical protein
MAKNTEEVVGKVEEPIEPVVPNLVSKSSNQFVKSASNSVRTCLPILLTSLLIVVVTCELIE